MTLFRVIIIFAILSFLSSCKLAKMGGDARENPPDPKLRVQKNLEEGKAFRLKDLGSNGRGGNFEFASSNELWRASLDTIDFIPLSSVNYSGGVIITDWYSNNNSTNESVKISIRFLTNEIRSDALDIKVFYKKCSLQESCQITDKTNALSNDIEKKILTKATLYKKENKSKNN